MKCSFNSCKRRMSGHHQAGVALIEIMVSLLIFALGVLGMVGMQSKSISYVVSAEDRSRAALLANEIVAAMWLEGTATPSTLAAWKARVKNAAVSGLPNADDPQVVTDATTKITRVTITWHAPSLGSGNNKSATVGHTSTDASTSTYFTQVVLP